MTEKKILVVDDEPDIRELIKDILEDEGYLVETAENGETARAKFSARMPDLVLLDIWMPDTDGISLLHEWQSQTDNCCPIVMISGHGTVETAVEATRAGAFDFVEKPLSLGKLILTVEQALTSGANNTQTATPSKAKSSLDPLGNSPAMSKLRAAAEQIADHDEAVLIRGESGAGKETLARYIHKHSQRREQPFVILDLSSVPDEQLRQSLLGDSNTSGMLEQAGNGTIYLSDLGQTPILAQQIINSVLESKQIQPGKSEFSARVIAACSDVPENLLEKGDLSKELYFRINVLPLNVPPLRERPEDVIELLRFYTEYFPNREKMQYRHFSVAAQNRLRNYDWPGNVRELRNLVKQLLIMGQGQEVSAQEVDQAITQSAVSSSADKDYSRVFKLPLREAREQFEREYLTHQLRKAGGSVGKLAAAVGMERTHLYRKLRALGINPKSVNKKS